MIQHMLIAESRGKVAGDCPAFFMGHRGNIEARYTDKQGNTFRNPCKRDASILLEITRVSRFGDRAKNHLKNTMMYTAMDLNQKSIQSFRS